MEVLHNNMKNFFTIKKFLVLVCVVILLSVSNTIYSSVQIDGIDDCITISDDNSLSFGNGTSDTAFSISAWIKMDDATSFRIFNKWAFNDAEYLLTVDASDFLLFSIYDQDNENRLSRAYVGATVTSYEGEWINVVATYDGSGTLGGMKIYLNGNRVDDYSDTLGSYTAMHNTATDVVIGCLVGYDNSDGQVNEVAIWDTELSQGEIEQLYNSKVKRMPLQIQPANLVGYWPMDDLASEQPFSRFKDDANAMGAWAMSGTTTETDLSGEGEDLTETSGIIPTSSDRIEGAFSRDFEESETEWLQAADGGSTDISGADQELSICAWVNREFPGTGSQEMVVSKYLTNVSDDRQYYLSVVGSTRRVWFTISSDGTSGNTVSANGLARIEDVEWHHICGVYNDIDMRIYVDGVLDSNGAENPKTYSSGIYNGTAVFAIGARFDAIGTSNSEWDGPIDEVMIFDRALTANEVFEIYGGRNVYKDISGNDNHGIAVGGAIPMAEEILSYP